VPKHPPAHYWHTNMYATFQTDRIGLQLLADIGADRVMWAQDYPHGEGTFGYTADAVRDIVKMTTPQEARLILGDTARHLYRI
jgi:predicted TIM-barrel fold metal-dependent hydrolase